MFEEDCVRVVAEQLHDSSFGDEDESPYACTLCWRHLVENPGKQFKRLVTGSTLSATYEIRMHHALVETLPLLHDVCTNAAGNTASIELPFSIWALGERSDSRGRQHDGA